MDLACLVDGKPSPELERDLANLRWLNRHFGAITLLHYFLRRWFSHRIPESAPLHILDLATGEGDLPREIVRWCRSRGLAVVIDAVDLNAATLAVAQERSVTFPEINFHQGDIRFWGESQKGRWDLILCSLALHHFSNGDAVILLRHMRELTLMNKDSHLLVADLERCRLGSLGIWLLTTFLLREPMTVHDAKLSIRRAFSFQELRELAVSAGWNKCSHRRFPVTRQALWMDSSTDNASD